VAGLVSRGEVHAIRRKGRVTATQTDAHAVGCGMITEKCGYEGAAHRPVLCKKRRRLRNPAEVRLSL